MKKNVAMFSGAGLAVFAAIWVTQTLLGLQEKPNVILISIDTLRPDVLGCYNKKSSLTPNIDRFAEKSVVFENAISVSPWTIPAHMSMFTGLYPTEHKMNIAYNVEEIYGKLSPLLPTIKTLGEIYKGQGYSCAAFTGGAYVMGRWGFARGFDLYDDGCPNIKKGVEKLTAWLRSHGRKRFFVFLHTYVMHAPYRQFQDVASASGKERYKLFEEKYRKAGGDGFRRDLIGLGKPGAEEVFSYYKGSAIYLDRYVGVLMDYLEKNGFLRNTVILFLSDHGEEFYEHNAFAHGHTLYAEQLSIPLILYIPGSFSQGKKCSKIVSNLDVFQTLCEIVRSKNTSAGVSLIKMLGGEKQRDFVLSEATHGAEMKSLTTGENRLIFNTRPGKYVFPWKENNEEWQFYDLKDDPGELHNQASLNASDFLRLKEIMRKIMAKNGFHEARRLEVSSGRDERKAGPSIQAGMAVFVRSIFFGEKAKGPSAGTADFQLHEDEVQKLKSLGYL